MIKYIILNLRRERMEIERKFLIKKLPKTLDLSKYTKKDIEQIYLYIDELSIIRIRKVTIKNNIKYKYTVKTGKKGISNQEYEVEISEEQYKRLYNNRNKNYIILNKTRYIIPYINNLNIELDIFSREYEGLILAEIEYESESQAKGIKVPDWFDMDISNSITNSDLASKKNILKDNNLINKK